MIKDFKYDDLVVKRYTHHAVTMRYSDIYKISKNLLDSQIKFHIIRIVRSRGIKGPILGSVLNKLCSAVKRDGQFKFVCGDFV